MLNMFGKMFGSGSQPVNQQQPVVNAVPPAIPPSAPAETPLPLPVNEPVAPPAPPQIPVSEQKSVAPEPIAPAPTILNAGPISESPQVFNTETAVAPSAPTLPSVPPQAPAVALDDAHKNKIGTQLTKTLVQGVENKEITEGEMSAIAGYILENIDTLKTQDDLFAFLKDLSTEWPIFKNVVTIEGNVAKQGDDEKKIEELTSLVHEQGTVN